MTHALPLYRRTKPVQHWKDIIRRQDEMTERLKSELYNIRIKNNG